MKSFPALTPAQRAKQLYQNGYCPKINQAKVKLPPIEHYIYNTSSDMIGYMTLPGDKKDMPERVRINGYWYKLSRRAKWDDL